MQDKASVAGAAETLLDRLDRHVDELTTQERRLAGHLTEHLERWGYLSSNELAVQLGVHRSTVVRFAQHIGFPGYPGLQEAARAEYKRSLSKPGELGRIDRGDGDLGSKSGE